MNKLDADRPTVHIRCGSDIRDGLAQAGFAGDFVEFSDPYCQGPLRESDFLDHRARFLSDEYARPVAQTLARLQRAEHELERAVLDYDRVVLWFEHDSYDQLILARILAQFAQAPRPPEWSLICIDAFAGIDDFRGLGQLSPAQLASLWPRRVAIENDHLALGKKAWSALLAPDPADLIRLVDAPTPAVPPMRNALRRHLMELPWTGSGLSLTQRLILDALTEGACSMAQLFRRITLEFEPLPFLGDTMFFAIVRNMASAPRPLLDVDDAASMPECHVETTPDGMAARGATLDWMSTAPAERWVGGVRVQGPAPAWRWSPDDDRAVAASVTR